VQVANDEKVRANLQDLMQELNTLESDVFHRRLAVRIEGEEDAAKLRRTFHLEVAKMEDQHAATRDRAVEELYTRLRKRKNMRGWQEVFDKASGSTYYYNKATNQTQWDPPVAMDLEPMVFDPDIVECVICAGTFEGHVSQCENGHTFCAECLSMHLAMSRTCPECRCWVDPERPIRNLLGEAMAEITRQNERKSSATLHDLIVAHKEKLSTLREKLENEVKSQRRLLDARLTASRNKYTNKDAHIVEEARLLYKAHYEKVEKVVKEAVLIKEVGAVYHTAKCTTELQSFA
jgi:hypothetical protein